MLPKVKKILDLSHDLFAECPIFFAAQPMRTYMEKYHGRDGFASERIDMNSHTATHVDVPFHFIPQGKTIEQVSLDHFQGRVFLIDLRGKVTTCIDKDDLISYEGKIDPGDAVILYTGWAQKRSSTAEFLVNFPYVTKEAAEWLIDQKINVVCTDADSVGGSCSEEALRGSHVAFLDAGVIIVEQAYLDQAIVDDLNSDTWLLTAYPLKLRGFGGSPTRLVATCFE